ncbi:MAG TPA: 2Fe-2S iron-sulfur cluster-binding protein [Solirubrobacteraceae bacterium]
MSSASGARPAVRRLVPTDCQVLVDGVEIAARAGETVSATLLAAGGWTAFSCGMGACFACLVRIDGEDGRRACLELTRPGMVVETRPAREPAGGH